MLGNALPDICLPWEIDRALEKVGFEVLVNDDLAETIRTGVPWYKALGAQKFTPAEFLKTPVGRRATSGADVVVRAPRPGAQGRPPCRHDTEPRGRCADPGRPTEYFHTHVLHPGP